MCIRKGILFTIGCLHQTAAYGNDISDCEISANIKYLEFHIRTQHLLENEPHLQYPLDVILTRWLRQIQFEFRNYPECKNDKPFRVGSGSCGGTQKNVPG